MFPILCSHASRAAPLRRCCLPCGMAFPRWNNKKCPSPPFQETETLKLLPSDSCSPCAKHFLTATNLGLSSIFYRTAPEKSIFFCRTSQFFCRRLRCCICLQQGEFRARERGSLLAAVTCRLFSSMPPAAPFLPAAKEMGGKNAAKNQWFLEFLSSDHSHAAKRPTPNRSCPYPRFRFHVPQENAVSYRRGTVYLRVVRRSGSDKRTARDSLYDDVRQFKSRVVRGGGFQRTPAAQEVLKPAVSSSVFGHFWGCGQK